MAGHRDAQTHVLCKLIKIITNKTPLGLLLVGGTRCFEQAMDWCLLVEGEYKLYHSVWEPPIMCLAWKISPSLSCYVEMKVYRSKYYSPLFQNRALAPLQVPASLCEGPIYLLLCWVIILLLKSTSWRTPLSFASITINLYWVWLWLDLFYHELQCLVSPWSLKVPCIYVLQSQKGLARYHLVISYYDCFEKVLSSEFYYYGSLADYAIDMSNCETYVLLWVWLVHVCTSSLVST